MQFSEKGGPSDHEIDVENRSPAHVEAWILIELLHRGVDRDRFSWKTKFRKSIDLADRRKTDDIDCVYLLMFEITSQYRE